MPIIFGSLSGVLFGLSLGILSLFLILIVLVQRGKGGGLTGALGGPGGQSAFGTKAGDVFTKITSITALLWIFLCAAAILTMGNGRSTPRGDNKSADADVPSLSGLESVDDVMGELDAGDEEEIANALSTDESTEPASEEDTSDATDADAAAEGPSLTAPTGEAEASETPDAPAAETEDSTDAATTESAESTESN